MTTKADGTAAIGRKPISSTPPALRENRKTARRRTAQAKKDTASKRSARVSWRRLSTQKIQATATNSNIEGITTGTLVKKFKAFNAAHRPRTPAATTHGIIQGLRAA